MQRLRPEHKKAKMFSRSPKRWNKGTNLYRFINTFGFLQEKFNKNWIKKARDCIIIKQNEENFKLDQRIIMLEKEAKKFILEDNPDKKTIRNMKKILGLIWINQQSGFCFFRTYCYLFFIYKVYLLNYQ